MVWLDQAAEILASAVSSVYSRDRAATGLGNTIPKFGPSRPGEQEAPLTPTEVLEWEEYFRKGRQDRGS